MNRPPNPRLGLRPSNPDAYVSFNNTGPSSCYMSTFHRPGEYHINLAFESLQQPRAQHTSAPGWPTSEINANVPGSPRPPAPFVMGSLGPHVSGTMRSPAHQPQGIMGSPGHQLPGIMGSPGHQPQGIMGSPGHQSQGIMGSPGHQSQGIIGSPGHQSQGIMGSPGPQAPGSPAAVGGAPFHPASDSGYGTSPRGSPSAHH